MKAFSPSSDRSVGVELYRSMAVLFSKLHEWLRKDMVDRDAEKMIDMATKHIMDQQREVQTNIHSELKNICTIIDMILGKNGPPTTIQHTRDKLLDDML
ncbi:hypothetical protein QQ045_030352 [Rhodiola kirilowii]